MANQTLLLSVGLSTVIWVGVVAFVVTSTPMAATTVGALERVWSHGAPQPGQAIPTAVRIIGVDGESRPRPYGIVIYDGRIVALVEASTRKVVEIVSDDAR